MPEADLQIKLLVFVCGTLCSGLGGFSKRNIAGRELVAFFFFNLTWENPIFYNILSFVFLLTFPFSHEFLLNFLLT